MPSSARKWKWPCTFSATPTECSYAVMPQRWETDGSTPSTERLSRPTRTLSTPSQGERGLYSASTSIATRLCYRGLVVRFCFTVVSVLDDLHVPSRLVPELSPRVRLGLMRARVLLPFDFMLASGPRFQPLTSPAVPYLTPRYVLSPSPFSSAHYLYPVRIRVVNDVTGVVHWHTIAYVPYVHIRKKPEAKEKAKGRRWGVLQRTLYLAFRDEMESSHNGVKLDDSIGGLFLAFFRILLYACDRPEERSVLCLKAGNCGHPCSNCDVLAEDACTDKGTTGVPRDVIDSLEYQMEIAALSQAGKKRPRRMYLESKRSINAFIHALACSGGLATAPHYLYKMIAFDPLHVRLSCPTRSFIW